MEHATKLTILLELDEGDRIEDVVAELPDYCASTFQNTRANYWYGEFQISCPVAPKLAAGDFVDDFAPYFPALLRLKTFHSAEYQLFIAVGKPAEEFFELEAHCVALLSALGASVLVQTAEWRRRTEAVAPNRSLPPTLNSTSSVRSSED